MRLSISLFIVAIAALWIRIDYFHNTLIDQPIRGDAASYVQYAFNMVNFGTYSKERGTSDPTPDAYWSPGYPALIAAAMLAEKQLGLDTYKTIIYTQAALGMLISILTLLTGRLFLGHYFSLAAALLVAFSPHMISLSNYVLTETLFSFLFLSSIYCFLQAYLNYKILLYILSGLLFGLSYLTNPVSFFTPLIFCGLALWQYSRENVQVSKAIQLITPCILSFMVIVASWNIRNNIVLPENSPSSSTRLLTNLTIGMHDNFHSIWRNNPRDRNNPATIDSREINGSYSKFIDILTDRLQQDPMHYAKWYLIQKPVMLWDWNILVGQGDIYVYPVKYSLFHTSKPAILIYSIMKALHYWLFGLAILGMIVCAVKFSKRNDNASIPTFLFLSLLYISAVYVITQAEARYSIPLRPEMYLCAFYLISTVAEVLRKSGGPKHNLPQPKAS